MLLDIQIYKAFVNTMYKWRAVFFCHNERVKLHIKSVSGIVFEIYGVTVFRYSESQSKTFGAKCDVHIKRD